MGHGTTASLILSPLWKLLVCFHPSVSPQQLLYFICSGSLKMSAGLLVYMQASYMQFRSKLTHIKMWALFSGFAFGIAAAVAELTGSDTQQDVWLHCFECFLLRCWTIKMYLMKEIKMPCSPFTAEFYFNVMYRVEKCLGTLVWGGLQIGSVKTAAIKLFGNLESHGNYQSMAMIVL